MILTSVSHGILNWKQVVSLYLLVSLPDRPVSISQHDRNKWSSSHLAAPTLGAFFPPHDIHGQLYYKFIFNCSTALAKAVLIVFPSPSFCMHAFRVMNWASLLLTPGCTLPGFPQTSILDSPAFAGRPVRSHHTHVNHLQSLPLFSHQQFNN